LTELKRLEEWLGDDHDLVVRYNAATAHECIQTTADVAGESAAAPERRFVDERADEEVGG
jgi:hypothetical protein